MFDWPIGLSTGCYHDTNLMECLPTVREAGFSMVEICTSPSHLDYHDIEATGAAARRLRELDMEAYSLHAPFSDQIDITSLDDGVRDRSRHDLMQAAEAAARLAVRYVVLHPGPESGESDPARREARRHRAVEVLNQVADRCRELGIALALENMLPHLFSGPARDLLWILGAMAEAGVGVCLDTGHAHLAGDLPSVVDKLSGHLWLIHANDNRGEGDDHLPPGEGTIDWQRLIERLSRAPFAGGVILEVAGRDDKQSVLAGARRGRLYLRDLSRRLALDALRRP